MRKPVCRVRCPRRTGGFTFAENPMHDCTCVMPVWSGEVDPFVLRARALPVASPDGRGFDASRANVRRLASPLGEHLAFDCQGDVGRIDVVEGNTNAEPVMIRFEIDADRRLDNQIRAMQRIFSSWQPRPAAARLQRQHLALLAMDERAAGASLREIAAIFLGTGDWPGDGEYRKSQIRRLVEAGMALCKAGPFEILWPRRAAGEAIPTACRSSRPTWRREFD